MARHEPDLADALAAVERPATQHLHVELGALARPYASPWLHGLPPWPASIRLAQLRGLLEWCLRPSMRRSTIARVKRALAEGSGSRDPARVARRAHIERRVRGEIGWRRLDPRYIRVEGLEHLRAARAGGRGVIQAAAHLGVPRALSEALAAHGHKLYIVREPLVERPLRGLPDRWTLNELGWIEEVGARYVVRGGAYAVCRALLDRGEICRMHVDTPGGTRVEVSRREHSVAGGIAALAWEVGVPVVPGYALREGTLLVVRFHEPIEPEDFPDAAALRSHLASLFHDLLLSHPEAIYEL